MKTFGTNYWDQGGLISGAAGELYLRDDEGLRYDFADGTWKALPAQPAGVMVEDPAFPGYYSLSVDPTGWGNRNVTAQSRLHLDGYSDQVDSYTFTVAGGLPAIPVYVANPGQGVQVILAVKNPDGTPSQKVHDASLAVIGDPPSDLSLVKRDPTWDAVNGCWVWLVPPNCQVLVSCMDVGVCGLYQVGTDPLFVNSATPLA